VFIERVSPPDVAVSRKAVLDDGYILNVRRPRGDPFFGLNSVSRCAPPAEFPEVNLKDLFAYGSGFPPSFPCRSPHPGCFKSADFAFFLRFLLELKAGTGGPFPPTSDSTPFERGVLRYQ